MLQYKDTVQYSTWIQYSTVHGYKQYSTLPVHMLHKDWDGRPCRQQPLWRSNWRSLCKLGCTVQYNTVSTIQYIAVQYNAVQYSTVQYNAVQYSIIQCIIVQYCAVQYSTMQCSAVQYTTIHYRAVQYSTIHDSAVQCYNRRGGWCQGVDHSIFHSVWCQCDRC